ncbi:hypothetical protein KFU94_46450 [Chloroflexi bacterium TSY]|nr:hypothetical protein [Chloroflexi bacterium TSY]
MNHPGFGIAKVAGLIFALIGMIIAIWMVYLVDALFRDPQSLGLIQQLAAADFQISITYSDLPIRFHAPDLLTYGVPIILLGTLTRMVTAFVTLGGNLLRSR